MKKIVYRFYNNEPVFSGTEEECWQWIVNQAQTINSKKEKFVRISQEKDDTIYDIGSAVYCIKNLNIKDIIKVNDTSKEYIVICAVDGTILEVGAEVDEEE